MDRILYEAPPFFVLRASGGYEVYRSGATAAVRVAQVGEGIPNALARAMQEADRRAAEAA